MTTSRVHITPHMHWDREWYFTTEESRILLVNNMEEILDQVLLEADANLMRTARNIAAMLKLGKQILS